MGTATSTIPPPDDNNNQNNSTLATLLEGHAITTPPSSSRTRQRRQSHNTDDDIDDDDDNTTITSSDNNNPSTTTTIMTNDWNTIHHRITNHPEETMLYAHSIEPSPLQRALSTHTIPPLTITRAFVDAYEDAIHSRDERGRTVLHSFTATHAWKYGRRTTTTTTDDDDDDDDDDDLVVVADTARYILSLSPDMTSSLTLDDVCLPLHYCRNNIHLAQVFITAHPEGLRKRDKWGRIPLHYLFLLDDDNRPADEEAVPCLDVVRLFISEGMRQGLGKGGGVLSRDGRGVTPLRRLCEMIDRRPMVMIPNDDPVGMGSRRRKGRRLAETKDKDETSERSDVTLSTVEETDDDDDDDDDLDDNSPDDQLCHILYQVVKHATMNDNDNSPNNTNTNTTTNDDDNDFLFLHSLLTLGLHSPPIISLALSLHSHHLPLRNHQGYTPLRLSLTPPIIPTPSTLLLLSTYPNAARMTDNSGRLPIDVVASEWGCYYDGEIVEGLVRAEPRAVDTRDLRNYLFPFLTAAIYGGGDVNKIYDLLRAKPHVLRYFGFG